MKQHPFFAGIDWEALERKEIPNPEIGRQIQKTQLLLGKFLNLFRKKKINPMVGGAGISAFPMSSRVVQKMAMKEDPTNIILMHAAGANVSGQIASVIAGGMVINLVSQFL